MHGSTSSQGPDEGASSAKFRSGCPIHKSVSESDIDPGLHGDTYYQNPWLVYDQLYRDQGTVALTHGMTGIPTWLVLGHKELQEVYDSDPENGGAFSRDSLHWNALSDGIIDENWPFLAQHLYRPGVKWGDGPNYRMLRAVMVDNFDAIDPKRIQKYVKRLSRTLIRDFIDAGKTDLVGQYTYELAVRVVIKLLGIPEKESENLALAARILVSDDDRSIMADGIINQTLFEAVAKKRLRPGSDTISQMIQEASEVDDSEIVAYIWYSMLSAIETTSGWIGNTILELLEQDRTGWSDLPIKEAMRSSLWNNPPAHTTTGRWATRDTVLGGKRIRKGDMLTLCSSTADQLRAEEESLDKAKSDPKFFWSGGIHVCPAQKYAGSIVFTAVSELRKMIPSMTLEVEKKEIRWRPHHNIRSMVSLPVVFLTEPKRFGIRDVTSRERSLLRRRALLLRKASMAFGRKKR